MCLIELFSKSSRILKAEPLVALRRVRNTLSVKAHFRGYGTPFASEKGSTNYRIVQSIPEKFPVGSFRKQKPASVLLNLRSQLG